jgi:hypothetical protein
MVVKLIDVDSLISSPMDGKDRQHDVPKEFAMEGMVVKLIDVDSHKQLSHQPSSPLSSPLPTDIDSH